MTEQLRHALPPPMWVLVSISKRGDEYMVPAPGDTTFLFDSEEQANKERDRLASQWGKYGNRYEVRAVGVVYL